jgi:dipeptidyl aminopeptidase/acylaminoacyl peptidase
MQHKQTAPYGTWRSPVTTDLIVGQTIGLGGLTVEDGRIYWLESRPMEGGRTVLVRREADGHENELTPAPFNVRSRVHEYGGGAYTVSGDRIAFVNFVDQRLHLIAGADPVTALTPAGACRYADMAFDPALPRLYAVQEDHAGDDEARNSLVAVALDGAGTVTELAAGRDFFAYPRPSPDGRQLAWISWDHPNMPWDGSDLWCAEIDADGGLGPPRHIAGGKAESIFQPAWSPDGVLHYVSDRSGWWNLYAASDPDPEMHHPLVPMAAEFGLPLWQFAMTSYRFLGDGRLLCRFNDGGISRLAYLDGGALKDIPSPYASGGVPYELDGKLIMVGAGPRRPSEIGIVDPVTGTAQVLKASATVTFDPDGISVGEAITFASTDGRLAHAFFYAPANKDFEAPAGERPPLIVKSHGGPTGATDIALSLQIQYWTSRGFAVVDVNYGGSTGYGRAYRALLDGQWGIVDVDDCVAAARGLSEAGRVDGDRLIIRGGSAGGYTTLSALAFRDVFHAGASHYGIGDLMALARDTHKFESRYLDRLIGPLPGSEAVYEARSPIHFTDGLDCPVIFFQGLEDKVVPPNQAELMVAALTAKGLPVAHVTFPGEGHGFRAAANISRALEAELCFYGRVFGFTPADDIPAVDIRNMP